MSFPPLSPLSLRSRALRHYRTATGVCVLGPLCRGACGSSPPVESCAPSHLRLIGVIFSHNIDSRHYGLSEVVEFFWLLCRDIDIMINIPSAISSGPGYHDGRGLQAPPAFKVSLVAVLRAPRPLRGERAMVAGRPLRCSASREVCGALRFFATHVAPDITPTLPPRSPLLSLPSPL